MTARVVGAVLVAAVFAGCAPGGASPGTISAVGGGDATYQTVAGRRAEVHLVIRDAPEVIPDLVLSFTGPNNWLLDHRSVATDQYGPCHISNAQIDCGVVSANEYLNVFLSGATTRAGRFEYTVAFWSVHDSHREAINAPDGHPLTLHWTEGVAAP